MRTRYLHLLHSLDSTVADMDVDANGLAVVVQLKREERHALTILCVVLVLRHRSKCALPPYPVTPPSAETCQTSGSCDVSPPLAEVLESLEHTEPS